MRAARCAKGVFDPMTAAASVAQYDWGFSAAAQLFANNGYVVLQVRPVNQAACDSSRGFELDHPSTVRRIRR